MTKMRSERDFAISSIDQLGRSISPVVLDAAQQISRRALPYGERILGDPAVVVSLLEQTAATVSLSLACESSASVHNLESYLFRAFLHEIGREKRKQSRLLEATVSRRRYRESFDPREEIQLGLLLDELLARCDLPTREVFRYRAKGLTWPEIGRLYGISSHVAETRFGKALKRLRREIDILEKFKSTQNLRQCGYRLCSSPAFKRQTARTPLGRRISVRSF